MKKVLGFCLVFLFFGAALGFSQANRVGRQELTVVSLYGEDGKNYASDVRTTFLNQYDDNTFQLVIYYRDGSSLYLYFAHPRRSYSGMATEYDVTVEDGGEYGFNYTGSVMQTGSFLSISVTRGNQTLLVMMLRS